MANAIKELARDAAGFWVHQNSTTPCRSLESQDKQRAVAVRCNDVIAIWRKSRLINLTSSRTEAERSQFLERIGIPYSQRAVVTR